jgi:DNA-directed RNA polymerase specialized sigma24 family protein
LFVFTKSPIGRRSAQRDTHFRFFASIARIAVRLVIRAVRQQRRALDPYWLARANGPVRGVADAATAAAAPRFRGIGFAPETIARKLRSAALLFFRKYWR